MDVVVGDVRGRADIYGVVAEACSRKAEKAKASLLGMGYGEH